MLVRSGWPLLGDRSEVERRHVRHVFLVERRRELMLLPPRVEARGRVAPEDDRPAVSNEHDAQGDEDLAESTTARALRLSRLRLLDEGRCWVREPVRGNSVRH